jgi:hypothetical protein
MKTLLRSLIALLTVLWLGGILFFPVVAQIAFSILPTKYEAGLVVKHSLTALHYEGVVAGSLLIGLLLLAGTFRAYGRTMLGPLLCTGAMVLLTVFSQWHIIPQMELDRIAVGGDIDKAPAGNPHRVDFDKLHVASVDLEEGVLAAGIAMVVLLARPALNESSRNNG